MWSLSLTGMKIYRGSQDFKMLVSQRRTVGGCCCEVCTGWMLFPSPTNSVKSLSWHWEKSYKNGQITTRYNLKIFVSTVRHCLSLNVYIYTVMLSLRLVFAIWKSWVYFGSLFIFCDQLLFLCQTRHNNTTLITATNILKTSDGTGLCIRDSCGLLDLTKCLFVCLYLCLIIVSVADRRWSRFCCHLVLSHAQAASCLSTPVSIPSCYTTIRNDEAGLVESKSRNRQYNHIITYYLLHTPNGRYYKCILISNKWPPDLYTWKED